MTAPAQLTAARVAAIITKWLALVAGKGDPIVFAGRFHDAIVTAGAWTLDDSGMWLQTSSGVGAGILALPFDVDASAGAVGATVTAIAGLLYVNSTAAAAQPTLELLTVNSGATTVAASVTAPASIGWHLVEWAGAAAIGISDIALLRITNGASGDRFAAGVAALEVT